MIKSTIIIEDKRFLNNLWFSLNPNVIRDKQNLCYYELKEYLLKNNIDLSTEDINSYEGSEIILFVDIPNKKKYIKSNSQIWYIILNEAPCAYEKNWNKKNHTQYDKLFTWDEAFVDNKKYFKIRLAYDLNYDDFGVQFKHRRLVTMIAGAKFSNYQGTIYHKRYEIIKWFCNYFPTEFDLYGVGWPDRLRPIYYSIIENRLPKVLKKLIESFYSKNIVYKGPVKNKREILSKYKFSICYENMEDKIGFVTEKIFDSLCSGCIPIYLGATNIMDLIPSNCFIDARLFDNYKSLYEHINGISEAQFYHYQLNIKEFLNSANGKKFTASFFAKKIGDHIISESKI